MDSNLEYATLQYVEAIKETDIYKEFHTQLEQLKQDSDKLQKVNEFRKRNFEIQNTFQKDEMFEKMRAFEQEYEKFREDAVVDEFLKAELAFCRMMQEINLLITEKVEFD